MARKKRSSFLLFPSLQEDSLSLYVNIISSDVSLKKQKKLFKLYLEKNSLIASLQ